jgi:LysM repeat protein
MLAMTLVGIFQPSLSIAQSDNLLQNGGFEGTYVAIGGDASLQVAPNWQPWSLPPPPNAESTAVNLRPDYQAAPQNRVLSGTAAQEYNTFFATHDGGVFQRVPVTPGAELEFAVSIYVWSSATFEDPDVSDQPQDVDVMVGIDPLGGQDGAAASIVWSDPQRFYDEYRELSVTATADSTAVTVFVRSNPQGSIGVNNIYVDDAALIQVGQTEPPPEPTVEASEEPTAEATEGATEEPTAEATEGATEAPTAEATEGATEAATDTPDVPGFPNRLTYTVQPGDTVFGIAQANNSTVAAIITANGLNSLGFITVGQELVIPVPAGTGTPAPTATQTPTDGTTPVTGGQYIVQRGDTLYGIALRFNTTVEALATLNNITNPNAITAGTILNVPGAGNTGGPTGGPSTYVVRPGDSAFRIAIANGITVEQLVQANGLANANLVFVGQVLVIP